MKIGTAVRVKSDAEIGTSVIPSVPHPGPSPAQVADWLRAVGLVVISAETRPRPAPGAVRPALDCVVLAEAPLEGSLEAS